MIVSMILYGMNIMKNKSKMIVDEYGTKRWRLPNGNLHREDGPAIENINGCYKAWYLNGKLDRKDGPAIECADGEKRWWLNGKLHREDGPAIEYANGEKHWYLNGKLHREDGPAIEYVSGNKYWYLNDRLYKIQYNNKTVERDKNFDCETCVSQIVCDIDCQRNIMWKEYDEK